MPDVNNFTINAEILESKIHFQGNFSRPDISEMVLYPAVDRPSFAEYLLVNSRENFNPYMMFSSKLTTFLL